MHKLQAARNNSYQPMMDKFLRSHYKRGGKVTPVHIARKLEPVERFVGSGLTYGEVFGNTSLPGYDSIDKDVAQVQVFFKSVSTLRNHKARTMTWTNFFSNIGGLFGLILGMGIISLFEIIWLFSSFFCWNRFLILIFKVNSTSNVIIILLTIDYEQ